MLPKLSVSMVMKMILMTSLSYVYATCYIESNILWCHDLIFGTIGKIFYGFGGSISWVGVAFRKAFRFPQLLVRGHSPRLRSGH